MNPVVVSSEVQAKGKFIQLETLNFTDDRGRARKWEACNRINTCGAAVIVPKFVPSGDLLLVRQFRPPAGKIMVEFPAGLIEKGESAESTAIRELYEETGYQGKVIKVFPAANTSPGLSGELVTLVVMEIDESAYPEVPQNHPEDSESIECVRVAEKDFDDFLQRELTAGRGVDAKLFFGSVLRH